MSEQEWLAEQFEANRRHLLAVAYRLLGSWVEAEDAVQESWLRLSRMEPSAIANLGGWLTTVVSRLCLDMLRSRRSRREESMEVHAARAQFASEADGSASDPEQEALLADSVGIALLVVLGTLNPAERVAFVLHDIFGMPFTEIAPVVGRSEQAARQLASRARRRVQVGKGELDANLAGHRKVVDAFLSAARRGDFDALVAALDPDVVVRDDRKPAPSSVSHGARALAQQIAGRAQAAQSALVNGSIGAIAAPGGQLLYVLRFTIRDGLIAEVDLISDRLRIHELDLAVFGEGYET